MGTRVVPYGFFTPRANMDAPPTTGRWKAGQMVMDDATGALYICIEGGVPGTWVTISPDP